MHWRMLRTVQKITNGTYTRTLSVEREKERNREMMMMMMMIWFPLFILFHIASYHIISFHIHIHTYMYVCVYVYVKERELCMYRHLIDVYVRVYHTYIYTYIVYITIHTNTYIFMAETRLIPTIPCFFYASIHTHTDIHANKYLHTCHTYIHVSMYECMLCMLCTYM